MPIIANDNISPPATDVLAGVELATKFLSIIEESKIDPPTAYYGLACAMTSYHVVIANQLPDQRTEIDVSLHRLIDTLLSAYTKI